MTNHCKAVKKKKEEEAKCSTETTRGWQSSQRKLHWLQLNMVMVVQLQDHVEPCDLQISQCLIRKSDVSHFRLGLKRSRNKKREVQVNRWHIWQTIEYERLKTSLSFVPFSLQLLSNEQSDVCGVLSHLLYLRAQSTMSKGATDTHTHTHARPQTSDLQLFSPWKDIQLWLLISNLLSDSWQHTHTCILSVM